MQAGALKPSCFLHSTIMWFLFLSRLSSMFSASLYTLSLGYSAFWHILPDKTIDVFLYQGWRLFFCTAWSLVRLDGACCLQNVRAFLPTNTSPVNPGALLQQIWCSFGAFLPCCADRLHSVIWARVMYSPTLWRSAVKIHSNCKSSLIASWQAASLKQGKNDSILLIGKSPPSLMMTSSKVFQNLIRRLSNKLKFLYWKNVIRDFHKMLHLILDICWFNIPLDLPSWIGR